MYYYYIALLKVVTNKFRFSFVVFGSYVGISYSVGHQCFRG